LNTKWYETFFSGAPVRFWDNAIPKEATQMQTEALERALGLPAAGTVLDIACGAGRHAIELASKQQRVLGIDISTEFLELARSRASGLPVRFLEVNLAEWSPDEEFDAAYWLGNGFGYLPHSVTVAWLRRLREAIRPQGRLVVETGCCAESLFFHFDPRSWYESGGVLMLIENEHVPEEGYLRTKVRHIEGGLETEAVFCHHVYTVAELKRMFGEAGFRLREVTSGPSGNPFQAGDRVAWFLFEASTQG
jgi:SAM-dependent methyltransferase